MNKKQLRMFAKWIRNFEHKKINTKLTTNIGDIDVVIEPIPHIVSKYAWGEKSTGIRKNPLKLEV